ALPRVTPYRDYLAWIAAQDRDAAIGAWRDALAGPRAATPLWSHGPARQARSHGVTLNTLLQAVWAILLARLTGRDDVVFGVTVAGRPPEIPGIEAMVGLLLNTSPLRVRPR